MQNVINKVKEKDGVKIIESDVIDDKRKVVAILIPHTYPNYSSNFFLSITALLSQTYWWNYTTGNRYAFDIATPPRNLGGIASIREGLADIAINLAKADYLFWTDSDQILPPDTIIKMLKHFEDSESGDKDTQNIEAVGALITFKEPPYVPHIYVKKHETKDTYHLARNIYLDRLMIVEGLGFGCCMIKAEVFKRVPKPWFEFKVDKDGQMLAGEDLGFCIKAKMKAILDPTIVVKHFEEKSFDINDFIRYNNLEVKDGFINPSVERANEIYNEHVGKITAKRKMQEPLIN